MKLKLDSDVLKNFFIQHCEKIGFGVCLLLVVLFVYYGYSMEGFDEQKTPDRLTSVAQRADENIRATQWDVFAVEEDRNTRGRYDERVMDAQRATESGPYAIKVPWDPPSGKPGTKRTDPTLFAPEKLEVGLIVR